MYVFECWSFFFAGSFVGQDNPARRERAAGLQEHEHKVLLLGRRQRSGGPQKRDHDPFMEHHPQRWKSTKVQGVN